MVLSALTEGGFGTRSGYCPGRHVTIVLLLAA